MKYTSFLNLKKPELGDSIDVDDLNDNMDTLDALIGGWFIDEGEPFEDEEEGES